MKEKVKIKYERIANHSQTSGIVSSCSGEKEYSNISDDYAHADGYESAADLGLGCGLPVALAKISTGDVIIDLGCGAGNDCFISRAETGPTGRVIGLDFASAMIEIANRNRDKLGYDNVEFIQGDIETMPLNDCIADVVVSNCVLNLVPDKAKAFSEIHRILKPGGHFSISDIVVAGEMSSTLQSELEEYAGCLSGSIQLQDYLKIIKGAGFTEIEIQKKRGIEVPEKMLLTHINKEDQYQFNQSFGIFSISVLAKK